MTLPTPTPPTQAALALERYVTRTVNAVIMCDTAVQANADVREILSELMSASEGQRQAMKDALSEAESDGTAFRLRAEQAEASLAALTAERDALREALAEALDEWEYASQYKGDYLAKKHGDAERIAELRVLHATAPPATAETPKPFKMSVSREWIERMAKIEEECGDVSVGAGNWPMPSETPPQDPRLAPCPACVSERGVANPNCSHCGGSGICPSEADPPTATERPLKQRGFCNTHGVTHVCPECTREANAIIDEMVKRLDVPK